MDMLYLNQCYNKVCYKGNCTVIYYFLSIFAVEDPTPVVIVSVNIAFDCSFNVETDCSQQSFNNIQPRIEIKIQAFFKSENSRAPGLCGINESACDLATVRLRPCTVTRKKRAATINTVTAEITLSNVS